jgi:hypothetical protein
VHRVGPPLARGKRRTYENKHIDVVIPNMKHNKSSHQRDQKTARALRPTVATDANQGGIDFAPSADEVARRAYFSYVNQGSLPGHDVQHWLEAEAHLLAERNLTRVHGFHNRT